MMNRRPVGLARRNVFGVPATLSAVLLALLAIFGLAIFTPAVLARGADVKTGGDPGAAGERIAT